MREPAFLRRNREKWLEYEQKLFSGDISAMNPDRLAELYIQLTDDLAYARTFYPKSKTVKYLNGLAAKTHLTIYQSKKKEKRKAFYFWTHELPLIMYRALPKMLYAFLIFTTAFCIGFLSSLQDREFVRTILGDEYVNMTIENIENGDPMGVYKDENKAGMFARIAINNVRVSFTAFAAGITLSILTGYVLFSNGVMLGAFLGFFHTKGLNMEALPVIYIHGTLELSAIVIAGGAGFLLGNSILFPGTFTRLQSLQKAAVEGVKIILGLVPVFLLAAWLESYVTRLTETSLVFKMMIIIPSLLYIIGYYVIYPIYLHRKIKTSTLI